jgi:hypothetical protein
MTHIPSQGPNLPPWQQGPGLGGFVGLAGIIVGLVSLGSVLTASLAAGVAAIAAIIAIGAVAIDAARKDAPTVSLVLLGISAAWAAFSGLIVFSWHWLAFTPALAVLDALFVAALAAGAWKKLATWAKALAALFAAAVALAVVAVPRPPGGEGPLDTAEKWKIDVEVADAADATPLEGARVLCGTVMQWEKALSLADTAARTTDATGRTETWEFEDDPRLKIAICNVWKDANAGNAGYPLATQIVPVLAGGGEFKLRFALAENPHPDTAFLTFDLSGTYQHEWYYLTFEVWDGEPQGAVRDATGPQPIMRKEWSELRGAGFTLSTADAARDLTVRYRYEGPSGPDLGPPYSETRNLHVGSIEAGTRRRVAVTIPAGQ